jgi:hypothetical protein
MSKREANVAQNRNVAVHLLHAESGVDMRRRSKGSTASVPSSLTVGAVRVGPITFHVARRRSVEQNCPRIRE